MAIFRATKNAGGVALWTTIAGQIHKSCRGELCGGVGALPAPSPNHICSDSTHLVQGRQEVLKNMRTLERSGYAVGAQK